MKEGRPAWRVVRPHADQEGIEITLRKAFSMELHVIVSDPVVQEPHRRVPLEDLARRIRDAHRAVRAATANALAAAFEAGEGLIEARACVSGGWEGWVQANCRFGASTARLYVQLARGRDEIEAKLKENPDFSLRAARRLLAKPRLKSEKPDPVGRAVANLRVLSDAQLTAVWTAYGLAPFLRTIPADMRSELERRIARLRSRTEGDEPVLQRPSEILRMALGHIRIAAQPETTPASAKLAETQAMQALRALARTLVDIDTDCVSIVNRYAKENRCSKNGRRTKTGRGARAA
jgi:hypothetical protein